MPRARLWQTVSRILNSPRVVFLVAFLARLRVLSELLPDSAWRYFYQYNEPARVAWAVVSGFGYSSPWPNTPLLPTAVLPPVYPYLIAAIFKLTGPYTYASLWIAVALNAVFSAATAVLILYIGTSTFSKTTGTLAAWTWACWLYEAVVSVRLWESGLTALLLAGSLLLLLKLPDSPHTLPWLRFGLLAGVTALTNTTALAVFPLFYLWLWIKCAHRQRSCRRLLLASIGTWLLVLLPWTIRNYETFHRFMPVRDNFGLELWMGNHEGVTHEFPRDFPPIDPTEYNREGEIRYMAAKRAIALRFIQQHPGQFLHLSAVRFYKHWTDPRDSAWWVVSLLAWAGMVLALRRKGCEAVPYAIVLLIFPVIYYITHTFSSYRHPAESVIVLLASYAFASAIEMMGRSWHRGTRHVSG